MKILITLMFVFASHYSYSQFELKGSVLNTENEPLIGATVVILEKADSTMYAFALTNDDGQYVMEDIEKGEYILQVSYVAHNNYSKVLECAWDGTSIDLAPVVLSESTELLQEITIEAEHIPMGLRGDTLSYNAAAFKTRPNASVEDLLKKLPGIEVDRDGSIKAQGEDVENVLVDGKEFFGSDPKMATKNLEAEAVDQVEVYDKQSEIAEFTGIDDGNEEKTINLKLKEEFKKGGFGNVDAAGGTEDRYTGKLNYFRFSPTLQASVIGATNNINKETFSINDRIDFMGGIGNLMSGGNLSISGYERLSDGINTSTSMGANFNYDFSSKFKLVSHYLQTRIDNDLKRTGNNELFNDSFAYSSLDTLNSRKSNLGHQINSKLMYKFSPFFNLILKNNLDWNETDRSRSSSSSFFRDQFSEGNSNSSLVSTSDDINFMSQAILKNKFGTKGRNLISNFKYIKGRSKIDENVQNLNSVSNNLIDINQDQEYSSDKHQFEFGANYTEPLGEKTFLHIKYGLNSNTESPIRNFFDIVDGSLTFNEDLSSEYKKKYYHHLGGFSIRRNNKRLKLEAGLNGQIVSLKGDLNGEIDVVDGTYKHLLPMLSIDYKLKGGKNMSFDYRTNIMAPRLEQLLPLPDNTSANSRYIGNPNLIPEYRHNLSVSFSWYDNFNFTNLWTSLSYSSTQNRIVNKTFVDENLFQNIEPINTERYSDVNGYFSFSRPFKKMGIVYKIRTNLRLANYDSFINNLKSAVQDNNYDVKLSINNRKTDHVNLETGIAFNYNTRRYGINADFNQDFFNTDYFLDFDIYLSKTWTFRSEFTFRKYSNDGFADSPDFKLWSASISKLLFDNKLEIRASVFDILNQNIGYRRFGSANSLNQSFFNNLNQYFLLGLNYKIGRGKKDGGIHFEVD